VARADDEGVVVVSGHMFWLAIEIVGRLKSRQRLQSRPAPTDL
jgi:hypothetical protein